MEQRRMRVRANADAATDESRAPLRRMRTAPVPLVYDPVDEVDPAASVPAAAALRRRRTTAPRAALGPLASAVVLSNPSVAPSRGLQTLTVDPDDADGPSSGPAACELLEELILDERVRVLADRMERERRAQDPSDPLRATRERIA